MWNIYEKPAQSFDGLMLGYLPLTLQKSIDTSGQLTEGISYLPSQNSVIIDRYKDLIYNFRQLFTEIAEYDELLTTLNFSDLEPTANLIEEFTVFEAHIDQGWNELDQFNSTDDGESQLLGIITDARTQYYKLHTRQQTQLKAKSLYGYEQYLSREQWEDRIKAVSYTHLTLPTNREV